MPLYNNLLSAKRGVILRIKWDLIPTMNLYIETLKLIQNRPATLQLNKIAEDLDISYSWILKFHKDEIRNPSYRTLQSLHDYLVSKQPQ